MKRKDAAMRLPVKVAKCAKHRSRLVLRLALYGDQILETNITHANVDVNQFLAIKNCSP
jgi:hypothetical protein